MKTPRRALKVSAAVVAALLVLALAAWAWLLLAPRHAPAGQPPLATLGPGSLPALRAAFTSAEGEVRVLVLLSPT